MEVGRRGSFAGRFSRGGPFLAFHQVENTDFKMFEQTIGEFRLQRPRSLQHVVQVRLRNPEHPRQAAFGELAIPDFGHNKRNQAALQIVKS